MAKIAKVQEVAQSSLRLESRKVSQLKAYENNPRIIDKAVPQVAESIRQCGYITPIVVDEDNIVLAGHTRLEALKSVGVDECEVVVVRGLEEDQKRKYRILDNKTGELASWDNAKLKVELDGLDFDGFDFGQIDVSTNILADLESGGVHNRVVYCPRCKAEVPA